jgi:hypothetical protein
MNSKQTLIEAFVKAQEMMTHAALDSNNPAFNSKYASLSSVLDAVKPALNANGIALIQKSVPTEAGISVETCFYGYGEELCTGPVPVPIGKANAHGFGSALTYAKRYSLCLACGISAEEDDDGNIATSQYKKTAPPAPKAPVVDEDKVTEYQAKIIDLVDAGTDADGIQAVFKEMGATKNLRSAVVAKLPEDYQRKLMSLGGEKK